jgi:hypothetical protein
VIKHCDTPESVCGKVSSTTHDGETLYDLYTEFGTGKKESGEKTTESIKFEETYKSTF